MSDIRDATDADRAFYDHCVRGLPGLQGFLGTGFDKSGSAIPYGLGPHSVRILRKALSLCSPSRILEIGFAQGYSASLFLEMTEARLTSVDISDKEETLAAAKILGDRYPRRFEFVCSDSSKVIEILSGRSYDLIYIDGDHFEAGVLHDIELGMNLGIPWFLFDDWLPEYGPGVQPAILRNPQIEIVFREENMALGYVRDSRSLPWQSSR
jgi:hypothetical protein